MFAMPTDFQLNSEQPLEKKPKFKKWFDKYWVRLRLILVKRYHSYYWRHLFAWLLISLVLSGPIYATGTDRLKYIDALYYGTSAITAAGLAPTDLSTEHTGTQILLLFGMLISGTVFESMIPLGIRLREIYRQGASDKKDEISSEEKWTSWTLFGLIFSYFILCQLLSFIILGFYLEYSNVGSEVMKNNDINGWWFNLFQSVSSFQNCGLGLLVDSLVQFSSQILPLLVYGTLILIGNTAYPIILRAILRITVLILRKYHSPLRIRLEEILRNPRSYTTHLFPTRQTHALLLSLLFLLVLQTALMASLDYDTPAFNGLSGGYVFANSLFQSIAVRTAGANSIPIGSLYVQSLVLMIGMMYLSVYPVTVSVRSTNTEIDSHKQNATYQLRRLLMQDALWVFSAWYLICAIEDYSAYDDGFKVLFEVCSAFGTVGLSLGLSNAPYAFSGSFSVASKLVIILMMLLGRHRGMPDCMDSVFLNAFRPPEVVSRHVEEEEHSNKDN